MAASLPPFPTPEAGLAFHPKRGLSIAALGRSRAACFRRSGLGPPPYFTCVITLAPVTAGPSCVAGALRRGRRPQGGLTHGGGFGSKATAAICPLQRQLFSKADMRTIEIAGLGHEDHESPKRINAADPSLAAAQNFGVEGDVGFPPTERAIPSRP